MTLYSLPNTFKRKALVTAVAAIASHSAMAESEKDAMPKMDMIVVVGQATSGMDSYISEERLDNVQANDLADVFRGNASVTAGGAVQMSQKIYVRNVGEDMLNITVDGAEQSGAVFHHSGRVAIEPELLKQVEIEAGAGSAAAGPGALGGSVRFTTKDPDDLLRAGETSGALVKATYMGNGNGIKSSATVFGQDADGTLSGMASFVNSSLDNLEDADGNEIIGTESDKQLGYAKLVANMGDSHYLSISYEKVTEEGDILYKPEFIASARNLASPTEGSRDTVIMNYEFSPGDELIDLEVNIYTTELMQDREFRGTGYDGSVETFGLTLQNTSRVNRHELIYGINYRDDTSSLNDVDFAPDSYFEETSSVTGFYVQDIISLTDQLTVSAGARFDDYQLTDVSDQDISDSGVSPNVSANYAVSQNLAISAGYAEAMRGPTIKDSFKLSSSTNDADLEAEKVKNFELGMDITQENLSVGIGAYNSIIENPIGGALPWSKVYENLEHDIETQGYFISTAYEMGSLLVSASFNSADSKMNDVLVTRYTHGSSAASSGDTLALDVTYALSSDLSLGWAAESVMGIDQETISLGADQITVEKPGYTTHDLYARWTPLGDDTLTLNLVVKNAFDEQYLSHASVEDLNHNAGWEGIVGSPESGRDIRFSAAYRF